MDESTRQREAEKLARDHKIKLEVVRTYLDNQEDWRGYGWLDKPSCTELNRRADQADALRKKLLEPGHICHAVEARAPDVPELLETVVAQLRGLTKGRWHEPGPGQRAPGKSSRMRPDELGAVEEAREIFFWAHPDESLGLTFDPNTKEPANAYTRWIAAVLVVLGVKRKAQPLLLKLRDVEEWMEKQHLGRSEAERRELEREHREELQDIKEYFEAELRERKQD